jgi:hypothetical protein
MIIQLNLTMPVFVSGSQIFDICVVKFNDKDVFISKRRVTMKDDDI